MNSSEAFPYNHPPTLAPSIAVRTRARKALAALGKPGTPLPKGWVKSRHVGDL